MASILRKAKNYVRKPYMAKGGNRHLFDPYTPEPVILSPPDSTNKVKKPDDISGRTLYSRIFKHFLNT